MDTNKIQQRLFEDLKSRNEKGSVAEELSDLLNVSIDSAYRRIRGEKLLDFAEIQQVCAHFGIQPSSLFANTQQNTVTFTYYPNLRSFSDFEKYILKIRDDILAIKPSEKVFLHISAADLPLFAHFRFQELTQFKFFYWLKYVIGDNQFANSTLDFELFQKELMQATQDIYAAYIKIPSLEIWSDDTLSSTIKQWKFFWESGSFESVKQAKLILDQIQQLLNKIKTQAMNCSKFIEGNIDKEANNFQLYYSDVTIGNNCIYLQTEHESEVYLSHYTYKSIKTNDLEFVSDTKNWLDVLIRKSILISGSGEKQRFQFFRLLEKKIASLYNMLE